MPDELQMLEEAREYAERRNKILRDMDVEAMKVLCREYDIPTPVNSHSFVAGMHKARILIPSMPADLIQESLGWLRRNGHSLPANIDPERGV